MSAFSDYTGVLKKTGTITFIKRVFTEMGEDGITVWASALAYAWLFAIFPFVIFLLSLVAFVPGDKEARVRQMTDFISRSMPSAASSSDIEEVKAGEKPAEAAQNPIVREVPVLLKNQSGGLLSFGIVLALWSASGGMATTMSALNRCYDVKRDRPFYIQKPLAILLTLIVMILIVTVLVLLPVVSGVLHWLQAAGGRFHLSWPIVILINIVRWAIAAGLLFLTVAVIYYFGPKLKRGFRFITPGSIFTVVAWIVLGLGLKWYISHFGASSYAKTYGAVGGVILLLLTFYLDALVLLIGAEINSEFDFALYGRTGGLAEKPDEPADPCEAPVPPGPDGGDRVAIRKPEPVAKSTPVTTKLALVGAGLATGLLMVGRRGKAKPVRPVLAKGRLPDRYPMTYRVMTRS